MFLARPAQQILEPNFYENRFSPDLIWVTSNPKTFFYNFCEVFPERNQRKNKFKAPSSKKSSLENQFYSNKLYLGWNFIEFKPILLRKINLTKNFV